MVWVNLLFICNILKVPRFIKSILHCFITKNTKSIRLQAKLKMTVTYKIMDGVIKYHRIDSC